MLNGTSPRAWAASFLRRTERLPEVELKADGELSVPPIPTATEVRSFGALFPRHPSAAGGLVGSLLPQSVKSTILGASLLLSVFTARLPASEAAPPRTPILYLGLNPDVDYEVGQLRRYSGASIDLIRPGRQADQIVFRGATYDLSTTEGADTFGRALGLSGPPLEAFQQAMARVGEGARDEAAQLALRFAEAEFGARRLERLVISGHNVGTGPWGDGNGHLPWSALGALTAVFPNAARQIEDLFVAACYSGGQTDMDEYQAIFPRLKTIWAYDGSAPGAASGAAVHLARWERATRGATEALDRQIALGTRKGEFVAVYTRAGGYQSGSPPVPLEDAEREYRHSAPEVARFYTGLETVEDPQSGPLRRHYGRLQHLLRRRDLPGERRAPLEAERDQVIRLLFFARIKETFIATHGAQIDSAYRSLGLAAPEWKDLDRAEVLEAIGRFERALEGAPSTPTLQQVQVLLHEGLRELRPTRIPETWI